MSTGSAVGATAVGIRVPPSPPLFSSPAPAAASAAAAAGHPTPGTGHISISGGGPVPLYNDRASAIAAGSETRAVTHEGPATLKPESSCNKTMFKIVAWVGFFTAVFGVFLFLGSYYCPPGSVGLTEATSMGALTPTFEAIGKMTAVWAFKLGTDAILLSSTIMTIGGVLMLTGIFGGILDNIRREHKRALEQAQAETVGHHRLVVDRQNAHEAAAAAQPDYDEEVGVSYEQMAAQLHAGSAPDAAGSAAARAAPPPLPFTQAVSELDAAGSAAAMAASFARAAPAPVQSPQAEAAALAAGAAVAIPPPGPGPVQPPANAPVAALEVPAHAAAAAAVPPPRREDQTSAPVPEPQASAAAAAALEPQAPTAPPLAAAEAAGAGANH